MVLKRSWPAVSQICTIREMHVADGGMRWRRGKFDDLQLDCFAIQLQSADFEVNT
jgi:hypothetical protein